MPLPQTFLNELHDRTDIVELINSYVQLKKRGRTWWALCPFHNEKTPSFVVYPDTSSYYCFGCGSGGDAITFIKQRENLEYIEAIKLLANRAGMSMPDDVDDGAFARRKRLLDANREAARFFFKQLNSDEGRKARGYLRKRGLDDATIKKFGIGYAGEGWHELRDALRKQGFRDDELIQAGLCSRSSKNDGVYDFFRDRAMFPIIDVRGSVVAFSGRTLGDDTRKYVNTPDTPVYKKSRTIYALNVAKNSDSRAMIMCEGQMDVIALHSAGFENAVAACGTALTDEQARMISQYADEVVLCYDSDEAGQKAARRAIDIFNKTTMNVRVLEYEGAKDPDEFIAKYGREKFAELLEGAGNATEYELMRAKKRHDTDTDAGRVEYLKEAAGILARAATPTERDLYAGRVADALGVSKGAILEQTERERRRTYAAKKKRADSDFARSAGGRWDSRSFERSKLGEVSAQRRLISLLFTSPDLAKRVCESISAEDFLSSDEGAIFSALTGLIEREEFLGFQSVSPLLSEAQTALLAGLVAETTGINFTAADADFLVDRIVRSRQAPAADEIKDMDAGELQRLIENKKSKDGAQ